MRNAVLYRGVWLTRGSQALALHEAKEFKKLDRHLKELDAKEHAAITQERNKVDTK